MVGYPSLLAVRVSLSVPRNLIEMVLLRSEGWKEGGRKNGALRSNLISNEENRILVVFCFVISCSISI